MKWLIVLSLLFTAQLSLAQLEIESLTGFTFKQTKDEVIQQARLLGDFVDMDKCIGVEGMNLLGYPNDVVFLDFHNNQLYGIMISIHPNGENEKIEIVNALRKVLISTYGNGFLTTLDASICWLSDPTNPYSDKVMLIGKSDSIIVSFLHGDLYHQAHPEIKIKAIQNMLKRALGSD